MHADILNMWKCPSITVSCWFSVLGMFCVFRKTSFYWDHPLLLATIYWDDDDHLTPLKGECFCFFFGDFLVFLGSFFLQWGSLYTRQPLNGGRIDQYHRNQEKMSYAVARIFSPLSTFTPALTRKYIHTTKVFIH